MTKQQLLHKVNPADIYLHYLRLSKFPTANISSPFSEDKKPSFRLYKNGTYKCFSTGSQGDVFQFVADLHHIDCKKNFNDIIEKIVSDLNLIVDSKPKSATKSTPPLRTERGPGGESFFPPNSSPSFHSEKKPGGEAAFSIETTPLTNLHYNFYHRYGVTPEILNTYGVQGVRKFRFWQESIQSLKTFPIYEGVVAFAYEVNRRYEIYIPEQKEKKVSKFFYNALTADDIFGLQQLPDDCDHIIIAAGKKDCLTLVAHGYHAVSFRSENHFPTPAQIAILESKLYTPSDKSDENQDDHQQQGALFICYDDDFTNPNNPGQTAQSRIIERYPSIIPVYLPAGYKDVAELYFKGASLDESFLLAKESIGALEKQQALEKETKTTIFHVAENYLSAHYKIRYNSIKLELQYRPVGGSFTSGNSGSREGAWKKINENTLFIEMQKKGINISVDKLVALLKSDFTPEFNPVLTYFQTLSPWHPSQPDYIAKLASFISCRDHPQFVVQFKKWLVRTVKCATIPDYFNKQALILVSPTQNDGKSTFCRFLCPPALSDYIAEDITNDKDARILLCRNFLINLDELAVLSRQEINSLKAFFSKTQINERLPYDRTNSIISRIASFIGSTNQDEFLADETGSVRWLCFTISQIDWNYKNQIDINRVWAQASYLSQVPCFEPEMNRDDIIENERRNRDFQILSIERELINKAFIVPGSDPDGKEQQALFMTSTEIMQHIISTEIVPNKGLNKIAIGKALKQEGFERIKHNGIYGYNVIPKREKSIHINSQT